MQSMPIINKKSDDSQLEWFWELTTKWWFFPVFYVFLTFLVTIIWKLKGHEDSFLGLFSALLLVLPSGIIFILQFIRTFGILSPFNGTFDQFINAASMVAPLIFLPFMLLSIIRIAYYKIKKGKILKWLIITLLLYLTLSFVGCSLAGPQDFNI